MRLAAEGIDLDHAVPALTAQVWFPPGLDALFSDQIPHHVGVFIVAAIKFFEFGFVDFAKVAQ